MAENEVNPDGESTEKAAFMLKSFPVATRKLIGTCAEKQGLTMGEWVDRAAHVVARMEKGERVLPPLSGAVPPGASRPVEMVDRLTTAELIEIARVAVEARAAGQGGMNDAGQVAGRLLSERLRASAGLPPPAVRTRPGARPTGLLGAAARKEPAMIESSQSGD